MNVYPIIKPILFKLDAEVAHYVSLYSLKLLNFFGFTKLLFKTNKANSVNLMGIDFPNRVGLAAGMDKNGDFIEELGSLGFGFIEVGTVTPRAQKGNPKPRLFRLINKRSIINRMGFNNKGIEHLTKKVAASFYPGVIGVNIGKNFDTSNDNAVNDYLHCYQKAYLVADYIVVNVSSPNTKDLRKLQSREELNKILETLLKERSKLLTECGRYVPLLVKISPDLEDFNDIISIVNELDLDGIVATNTTISREDIPEHNDLKGGLSGDLLFNRSLEVVKIIKSLLKEDKVLIGVGGINSVENAKELLESGADLIQIYSGLVYSGPNLIKDIVDSV